MTDAAIVEEDVTSGSIDEAKSYYMVRVCSYTASVPHCLNYITINWSKYCLICEQSSDFILVIIKFDM